MTWNGTLFVAVGFGGTSSTAYSCDGKTWTAGNNIFTTIGSGVTWNGNLFVAVGQGDEKTPGSTAYSYDGKTWSQGTDIFSGHGRVGDIVGGGGVGVTWNGTLFVAVGQGDEKSPDSGSTAYSYDGKTWYPSNNNNNNNNNIFKTGRGVTWNGTLFVAVGQSDEKTPGSGSTAYSYDGKTWYRGTDIFTTKLTAAGYSVTCTSFLYNIDMITPTIAVGSGVDSIAYSLDGNKWTGASNIFSIDCCGVAWNGSIYIAVGHGVVSPIAYSYDGITWYPSSNATSVFGVNSGFNGIAWNGTRFVVVGYNSSFYIGYSSDGINWSIASTNGTIFSGSNAYSVAWNGSRFVAVGGGPSKISYSSDGISWTASNNGSTIFNSGEVYGIAWNGKNFVAVGFGSNGVGYSSDGITWTKSVSGSNLLTIGNDSRNCVACNATAFVAGGTGTNKIIYSTDSGVNWIASDTALTGGNTIFSQVNAVTWDGKRFVAAGSGTTKIGYSYDDGITWVASDNGNSVFTGIVRGVGGGNPNFGPVPINSTLTFKSEDRLTFNVDLFNSNVNDISVSFLTSSP